MTNKYNNWERIERVLEYVQMNANAFAIHIGMQRSENIYHIKRGAFGISEELVERITARFPEINPTWLLSGVGDMLLNNTGHCQNLFCSLISTLSAKINSKQEYYTIL